MSAADPRAVVALGSNLGDSEALILRALGRLEALSEGPLVASSLWRTAPVDCPPGSGSFINAVALMRPKQGLGPTELLEHFQALEREFGRRPKQVLNEARPLDLDLIDFGSVILGTPSLVLPHPRAHERRFVVGPLAEIAPGWVFAGQTLTASEWLSRLDRAP